MSKTLTILLSDADYEAVRAAAERAKQSPEELIAAAVSARFSEPPAVIAPLRSAGGRRLKKRTLTPRAIEVFRSAAGSWSDVDIDRFLADVYAARDVPDERPPVAF